MTAAVSPAAHDPERGRPDSRWLRHAFGAFPTGVTVVTVGGVRPHGMTANSFTAVSLDPPMVLVCVARTAVMHARILAADFFAVSVLGEHHELVARHFSDSSRPEGLAQFEHTCWTRGETSGAPVIADAEAVFECRRDAVYDGGDHAIVLGEVLALGRGDEETPLIFAHGRLSPWSPSRPVDVGPRT